MNKLYNYLLLFLLVIISSCDDRSEIGYNLEPYPEPVDVDYAVAEGHAYVDFELPSGVLWATCNVGASSPIDPGYQFALGETTPKSEYTEHTYTGPYRDGASIPDIANANWGGHWRMPTASEVSELYDKCGWKSSINIEGIIVEYAEIDGQILIFPLGDYRSQGYGYYHGYSRSVYSISMTSYYSSDRDRAFSGMYVRPVIDPIKVDYTYISLNRNQTKTINITSIGEWDAHVDNNEIELKKEGDKLIVTNNCSSYSNSGTSTINIYFINNKGERKIKKKISVEARYY